MSNLGKGSNIGRIAPWDRDLDNATNLFVNLSTNEGSGGMRSLKTKKPKTSHDKKPTYPPPRYVAYAYEVCLQRYKTQTMPNLEKKYLRYIEIGSEKLKKDLEEVIRNKYKKSSDYDDVDFTYFNQMDAWIANCL